MSGNVQKPLEGEKVSKARISCDGLCTSILRTIFLGAFIAHWGKDVSSWMQFSSSRTAVQLNSDNHSM